MKKVININFQGRVIPIEEPAFEKLRNYTDSLRRYFAEEDGRDEIINDIENRIAELFSERLNKNVAGCITETDLEEIIASMGRPEDFDGEVTEVDPVKFEKNTEGRSNSSAYEPRGSFYRNNNDKILGGVCSGLATYLKVDPAIVRILFAIVTLGGFGSGFLLYIILWIILPARDLEQGSRKRLYRNPDQKMIGGVCGGIASYLNIAVWIPRLFFLLPFILGIIGNMFLDFFGPSHNTEDIIFGSFGGTFFISYLIMWIVVPLAQTASERLEMKGEKVDVASIRNAIQEELNGVKGRSEKIGEDLKSKAEAWGSEVKERAQAFSEQASPLAKNAGNGIGHAIGVLFKAFFLFIAGIIVFSLFIALVAILIAAFGIYPVKNFFLDGFWHNASAWGTLILFLGVPIVALVVWLIRRITGVRSTNNYLGYVFGTLWTFGWVSLMMFAGLTGRQYKNTVDTRETLPIEQPSNGRLMIDLGESPGKFYGMNFVESGGEELNILSAREDSMLLSTVKIRIAKSRDSQYHASIIKVSKGKTPVEAEQHAGSIDFTVKQEDSILYLPKGFVITKEKKFHNQQVILVIEVPVNKSIRVDRRTEWFDWYNVGSGYNGIKISNDRDEINNYAWRSDVWYIMTENGLERMSRKDRMEREMEAEPIKDDGMKKIDIDMDGLRINVDDKDSSVRIRSNAIISDPAPRRISQNRSLKDEERQKDPELPKMFSFPDVLKLDL
jgi:phage shock protein PspC (stress-responsive transcriptional regulator)